MPADRRVTRVVAAFGVAAAGVGIAGGLVDPAATSSARATSAAAPLLSVRRTPDVLRLAIGRQRLAGALDLVMSAPEFAAARTASCLVASVDGGIVYGEGATRPVIPASTLKVLTAATALSVIPTGEGFTTEVRSTVPVENGVLRGDLWLVGGGDPLLETPEYGRTQDHSLEIATNIEALADKVVAAGITRIDGSVVGDDRRYDNVRTVKTWKRQYLADGEVGPIGALSINDNFTVRNARGQRTGATDPPRDAAAEFALLLTDRGISIGGEPRGAVTEPAAPIAAPTVVASIESLPIESVVEEVLVWSDNTAAEMLLKEVGYRSANAPGSVANGVAAVERFVAEHTDGGAYVGADGSGLDRGNQVTCSVLVGVLADAPPGGALERALPVMGKTGTLRRRLRDDAAAGKVRAKTGSLNGVSSLAGFADTGDGSRAVFAFVGNGLASTATGVEIGNRVAQLLVRFPDAPPLEQLELP